MSLRRLLAAACVAVPLSADVTYGDPVMDIGN